MPAFRRFASQSSCRLAIAKVYRDLEADRIEPEKARVLIYASLSISKILETATAEELAERLQALESRFGMPKLARPA